MRFAHTLFAAIFGPLLAFSFATPASAFCRTITYTVRALSENDALQAASARGLVEMQRLNQQYGSRIRYQPAKRSCTDDSHVQCKITQQYCVADAQPRGPRCGPNAVPAPNDAGCVCKPGFARFQGECIAKSVAQPWNSSSCKAAKLACSRGVQSACLREESVCNPN